MHALGTSTITISTLFSKLLVETEETLAMLGLVLALGPLVLAPPPLRVTRQGCRSCVMSGIQAEPTSEASELEVTPTKLGPVVAPAIVGATSLKVATGILSKVVGTTVIATAALLNSSVLSCFSLCLRFVTPHPTSTRSVWCRQR